MPTSIGAPSTYRVYLTGPRSTHHVVNGVLDHTLIGNARTILYVPVGQTSRIDVVAVDEAGNQSAPATIFVTRS